MEKWKRLLVGQSVPKLFCSVLFFESIVHIIARILSCHSFISVKICGNDSHFSEIAHKIKKKILKKILLLEWLPFPQKLTYGSRIDFFGILKSPGVHFHYDGNTFLFPISVAANIGKISAWYNVRDRCLIKKKLPTKRWI